MPSLYLISILHLDETHCEEHYVHHPPILKRSDILYEDILYLVLIDLIALYP